MGAMDHLIQKLVSDAINSAGFTPEELKAKALEMCDHVIAFRNQVDRIEKQNAEILTYLQTTNKDFEHGQNTSAQITNGNSGTEIDAH